MRLFKVIAEQCGDAYLIVDAKTVEPTEAQVFDLEADTLYPPFNLQSILARGYWEEFETESRVMVHLLSFLRRRAARLLLEERVIEELEQLWDQFSKELNVERRRRIMWKAGVVRNRAPMRADIPDYLGNMLTHILRDWRPLDLGEPLELDSTREL